MKICLVVCFFFAFLITVLTSNLVIHCSRQSEVELSAAMQDDISWLKQLYLKSDGCFFFSCLVLLLLFFVRASVRLVFFCCDEWAQGQNGVYPLIWPASPDMGNAHSRWHYFGVCTRCATTPFISCELKFTTYPLTEGVNSSNMTQALILLGKQKKTCLSLSTFLDKENNKQSCFIFSLYILLNKSENLKSGLKIWGNSKKWTRCESCDVDTDFISVFCAGLPEVGVRLCTMLP